MRLVSPAGSPSDELDVTDDGLDPQELYRDALVCVERSELSRARSKLRLALLQDPNLTDARLALERLMP